MGTINILIVDDHQLILNGVKEMLKPIKHFKIIGTATNGQMAIQKALELNPDVIFIDVSMPVMNGVEATREITSKLPDVKILALTQHDENAYVVQILKAGAQGYMLKNSRREEFEEAINTVLEGKKYFSREISDRMLNELVSKQISSNQNTNDDIHLTKREIEIIQKIADDMSNQEIADELNISLRTVETHRRNLMQKLKVKSVVALLKYAAQRNIISFE